MQTTDGQKLWEKHNNVNEHTRLEKQAALSDDPGPVETERIRK